MGAWILLVVLVVLLCAVVTFIEYKKPSKLRGRALEELAMSCGTYDDHAESAIEAIESIPKARKTSSDRYLAGRVRDLNLTEGSIADAPRDTAMNIVRDYVLAMDMAANEQEMGIRGHIPPVVIIEGVGGFVERNYPLLGERFLDHYHGAASTITTRDTSQKSTSAQKQATSRKDYTDRFVNSSVTHTADPQNSHDSSVNVSLRNTLALLRSTNTTNLDFATCVDEALGTVTMCGDLSPGRQAAAVRAVRALNPNNIISTLASDEGEVFQLVWNRSHDPANSDHADIIRANIISALADFYEIDADGLPRDRPVCINGRCARLLESLAVCDHDSKLSGALTIEERKNTLYEEIRTMLNAAIAEAKSSQDPDTQAVGASYEDPSITTKPEAEARFREGLTNRVDEILSRHEAFFPGALFDGVRRDAHAAIA